MTMIAKSLNRIKPSQTIAVTTKAKELKAAGKDVIDLGAGEPDFDTPENIRAAAVEAIRRGETRYTAVDGTPLLKQAVVTKFMRENAIHYNLDEITVGTGAKQVLYNAIMATIDPDDEVIIPAPYWVSYPDIVLLAGGKPVIIATDDISNFKITPQQLESAITPRSKWFILNSPSNPTGSCYSQNELKALSEVLLRYPHLLILSDDIYEHLIFDGLKFATIAGIEPKLKSRTLTLNGVSKSYAMTGWRLGYGGAPAELIKAIAKIQSQSTSNPSSISQAAAVEALNGPQDFIKSNARIFEKRRDLVVGGLNDILGITCNKPNGAFYVFPSCSAFFGGTIQNSADFCTYLLEEALVAVVPGSAFGLEGFFRISYATSEGLLMEAIKRIATACSKLSQQNKHHIN